MDAYAKARPTALMERERLEDQEAFTHLRRAARSSGRKLNDTREAMATAVRLLQRLRVRHGLGSLRPRLPGRSVALMLSPEHVQRVLSGSPEPFAVANREKRGALSHFQPHGVLVSHGRLRADRRRVNEEVLDSHRPVHRLAEAITAKVLAEARPLVPESLSGSLAWNDFRHRLVAGPTWMSPHPAAWPSWSPAHRARLGPTPAARPHNGCSPLTLLAWPPSGPWRCSPPTKPKPRRCPPNSPAGTGPLSRTQPGPVGDQHAAGWAAGAPRVPPDLPQHPWSTTSPCQAPRIPSRCASR